jgi:hypothetical protein
MVTGRAASMALVRRLAEQALSSSASGLPGPATSHSWPATEADAVGPAQDVLHQPGGDMQPKYRADTVYKHHV